MWAQVLSNLASGFFMSGLAFLVSRWLREVDKMSGGDTLLWLAFICFFAGIILGVVAFVLYRSEREIEKKESNEFKNCVRKIASGAVIPSNRDQLIRSLIKVRETAIAAIDNSPHYEPRIADAFNEAQAALNAEKTIAGGEYGKLVDLVFSFVGARVIIGTFNRTRDAKKTEDAKSLLKEGIDEAIKAIGLISSSSNNDGKTQDHKA
jgi:hypothetical protein